jgi:hypothetical protein
MLRVEAEAERGSWRGMSLGKRTYQEEITETLEALIIPER